MKKIIYLTLTIILGLLFTVMAHALIELWYLNWAEESGKEIVWTSIFGQANCALPWWLQWGLMIIGIAGGYLVGRFWWRLVYSKKK